MTTYAESVLTPRSYAHHFGPNVHADHYVYRIYDADEVLLYIGCTKGVERRIAAHLRGSNKVGKWLAVTYHRHEVEGPFRGRDAGRDIERAAINAEQPLFNTQERANERQAAWMTRGAIQRYLVEHGHLDLALETVCTCWPESREVGAYDSWCFSHVAAQVAGITNLEAAS